MKTRLLLLIFCSLWCLFSPIHGQDTKTTILNAKAQELLFHRQYEKSIKTFQKVLDIDNQNPIALRNLSHAYRLVNEVELAEIMLDKFIDLHPMHSRLAYYEAARLKFHLGKYEEAQSFLHNFELMQEIPDHEFSIAVEHELEDEIQARKQSVVLKEQLITAIDIQKFGSMSEVTNLGRNINTPADEYFPYLTNDRSLIFYTRRKDQYTHEDLFFSESSNEAWELGRNVGFEFNSNKNEGMSTILRNGRKLFFTACDRPAVKGTCDIWTADLNGHKISQLEQLTGLSNSEYWESQASISCDGDVLYFASNRPGGHGGTDIWMSTLDEEGNWSEAKNLGPNINTEEDEEAPFISNDSKTLFFSSTGHPGLGEQDMFLSRLDQAGHWQKPVNLGAPINSSYRELGFYLSSNGTTGYFASDRDHPQAAGGLDIYSFELPDELNADPVTYVELVVVDSISKKPIVCTVFTEEEGKLITDYNGRIFICAAANTTLSLTILEPGYDLLSRTIQVPQWDNSVMFSILLPLQPEANYIHAETLSFSEGPQPIESTHQVYFGFNKKKMDGIEKGKLQAYIETLPVKDQIIEIEIKGFSDQTGDDLYNLKLSEERANNIAVFLKNRGYRVDRVYIEGGGEIKDDIPDEEKRKVEIKIYHQ